MADDRYSVELGLQFESLSSAEAKLEKVVKSLSKDKQVELGINVSNLKELINDFGQINKTNVKIFSDGETRKLTEIQAGLRNTLKIIEDSKKGLSLDITSNPAKEQKKLYDELHKLQNSEFRIREKILSVDGERQKIYKEMLATTKKMQTEVDKTISDGGLNSAKLNNGLLQERIQLTNKLKLAQLDVVDKQKEEIQQMEQAVRKREELKAKQWNNQLKADNEAKLQQQLEQQKQLYNELNSLQNQEMRIKQQMINADNEALDTLKRQLETIREKQRIAGEKITNQNLESEQLINEILKNREKLQNNLDVTQSKKNDKVKQEQIEIEKLIELERKRLGNKLTRIQNSSYSKYLDPKDIVKFREELEKLNGTSLKDVRHQVKQLSQDIDTRVVNARAERTANEGFLSSTRNMLTSFGIIFSGQMVFRSIINTFRNATDSVIELDNALVDLKKVTDESEATYDRFLGTVHKMGMKLGETSREIVNAVSMWAKTGEDLENATKLANNTILLSKVGDVNVEQAQSYLVAPLKAFNIEADKSIGLIDEFNNISNNSASTVQDLGEGLKRSASAMEVAGNSLEQTLTLIAATQERTQLGGEVIGNALKTVSLRIATFKDENGQVIPKLKEDLEGLGVQMTDTTGQIRSTFDILYDLSKIFKDLDKNTQLNLTEKLGGKMQANIVASAVSDSERLKEIYELANNSAGSADEEFKRYTESIVFSLDQLREQIEATYRTLVDGKQFKEGIQFLTSFVGVIQTVIDKFGSLNTMFTTVILMLTTFNTKLKTTIAESKTMKFLNNQDKDNLGLMQKWNNQLTDWSDGLKRSRAAAIEAGQGHTVLSAKLMGANVATKALKLSTMALQGVMSVGISIAISLLITNIMKLINHMSELKNKTEELVSTVQQNLRQNSDMITFLQKEGQEFDRLSNKVKLTTDEQSKLADMKQRIADSLPELISGYNAETGEIEIQAKSTAELIELLKEKNKLENMKLIASGGDARKVAENDLKDFERDKKRVNEELNKLENGATVGSRGGYYRDPNNIKDLEAKIEQYKAAGKDTIKLQDKLNELYEKKAEKLAELQVLDSNQKDSLQALQPHIRATIENYEELDETQKRIVEKAIKLTPEDILDGVNYNAKIREIADKIQSMPESKSISVYAKLEEPTQKDYENYFVAIENIAKTTNLKPIEVAQTFKINPKNINDYVKDLEEKVKTATGKAKKDLEGKLDLYNSLELDVKVNGQEQVDDLKESVKEIQDALTDSINKVEDYNKFLEDINENGSLSIENQKKIIAQHPELLQYLGNEQAMRAKLNELVAEEAKIAQETHYKMLQSSEDYYNRKIKGDVDMQNKILQAYKEFGGKLGEIYNGDLENYKTLEENKGKATQQLLQGLVGAWSEYWNDTTNDFDDELWYGLRWNPERTKEMKEVRDKIRAMKKKFDDITIEPIKIDFSTIGTDIDKTNEKVKKSERQLSATEKAIYDVEQAMKELEQRIQRLNSQQDKLNNHSQKYRDKLKEEQKLIKEKIALLEKQISLNDKLLKNPAERSSYDPETYSRSSRNVGRTVGEQIVREAEKYLGTDYVWGGNSPSGFDCSGLVQYVYESLGHELSRTTYTQFKEGTSVNRKDLREGDLVFFGSDLHHVGIYAGNNKVLHSPETGDVVKYSDLDAFGDYYGARRILNNGTQIGKSGTAAQVKEEYDYAGKAIDFQNQIDGLWNEVAKIDVEILESHLGEFEDKVKTVERQIDYYREKVNAAGEYNKTYLSWLNEINKSEREKYEILKQQQAFVQNELKSKKYDEKTIASLKVQFEELNGSILKANNSIKEIGYELSEAKWNNIQKIYQTNIDKIQNKMDILSSNEQKNIKEIIELQKQKVEEEEENIKRITELIQHLNEESQKPNNAFLIDKIEEYNKELDKSNSLLAQHKHELNQIGEKIQSVFNPIESQIKELLSKNNQLLQESMDNNLKHVTDAIDKELAKLDEAQKKLSWSEQQTDSANRINDLKRQIAELQGDNSAEARSKKKDLEKQLKDELNKQKDSQMKHNVELQKDELNKQKDEATKETERLKQDLEVQLDNYYMNLEVKRALLDGYITDINGNRVAIEDAMLEYLDLYGDGVTLLGDKIKTEFIDNLKAAQDLLKGFDKEVGFDNLIYAQSNVKTVYGTGIDLENSKAILGANGYRYVDTALIDVSKTAFGKNDIILGGKGTHGGVDRSDLNGAVRLEGTDRYQTANVIKLYKDIEDGTIQASGGKVYGHGVDLLNAMRYLAPLGYEFIDLDKVNLNDLQLGDNDIVVGNGSLKPKGGTHLWGKDRYETNNKIKDYANGAMGDLMWQNYRRPELGTIYGKKTDIDIARQYLSDFASNFVVTDTVKDRKLQANDVIVGGQIDGREQIANSGANWLWGSNREDTKNEILRFKKKLERLAGYDSGGVNDFTDIAMLHGKPNSIETIFNATQGKKLFNLVDGLPNSFLHNRLDFSEITSHTQQATPNLRDIKVDVHVDKMYGTEEGVNKFADVLIDKMQRANLQ
ncbi:MULTISPECIES: phage tail tape measure protein [unclassified Clostridium]|uniref:phage tail tape measure protein n=1 Tax=unclassified Clostridium TaxID=2614128 RepID=UPI0025C698DF|nr:MULTISPECIES: phage tail tape measure protein [unclassified Clostridium]